MDNCEVMLIVEIYDYVQVSVLNDYCNVILKIDVKKFDEVFSSLFVVEVIDSVSCLRDFISFFFSYFGIV